MGASFYENYFSRLFLSADFWWAVGHLALAVGLLVSSLIARIYIDKWKAKSDRVLELPQELQQCQQSLPNGLKP